MKASEGRDIQQLQRNSKRRPEKQYSKGQRIEKAGVRLLHLKIKDGTYIAIAHMFCAPRNTRISYGWCLLIQGYFCAVQNYVEKAELST